MSISSIFLISLILSVVYNYYELKKGSYRRFSFWVNVLLVAIFVAFFFWFWLTAFERMGVRNVEVGADVMFF